MLAGAAPPPPTPEPPSQARKIASRNEYDKTIQETEAAYAKIMESSQACRGPAQKREWGHCGPGRRTEHPPLPPPLLTPLPPPDPAARAQARVRQPAEEESAVRVRVATETKGGGRERARLCEGDWSRQIGCWRLARLDPCVAQRARAVSRPRGVGGGGGAGGGPDTVSAQSCVLYCGPQEKYIVLKYVGRLVGLLDGLCLCLTRLSSNQAGPVASLSVSQNSSPNTITYTRAPAALAANTRRGVDRARLGSPVESPPHSAPAPRALKRRAVGGALRQPAGHVRLRRSPRSRIAAACSSWCPCCPRPAGRSAAAPPRWRTGSSWSALLQAGGEGRRQQGERGERGGGRRAAVAELVLGEDLELRLPLRLRGVGGGGGPCRGSRSADTRGVRGAL